MTFDLVERCLHEIARRSLGELVEKKLIVGLFLFVFQLRNVRARWRELMSGGIGRPLPIDPFVVGIVGLSVVRNCSMPAFRGCVPILFRIETGDTAGR